MQRDLIEPKEEAEYYMLPEEALHLLPEEWRNNFEAMADSGRAALAAPSTMTSTGHTKGRTHPMKPTKSKIRRSNRNQPGFATQSLHERTFNSPSGITKRANSARQLRLTPPNLGTSFLGFLYERLYRGKCALNHNGITSRIQMPHRI